jgi:U3 small nucleolar RNA-associated protein 8
MSLSDLYTLVKMPRVSGVSQRAVSIRDFSSDELHVGISGASISSYILKPSPKLIWSHSIPPSFTVTSLEIYGDEIYAGIYNKAKKQHLVQVIKKLENDSELVKEIVVGSKVIDIKRSLSNLIVVLEDETISYDREYNVHWKINALYKAIYSKFIEGDLILIVEANKKQTNLNFKLVTFKGQEISSKIIESKTPFPNLTFTYNEGTLYQHFDNSLKLYRVPHFQEFKELNLFELSIMPSATQFSMSSPAKDRLIIAQDNDLYLINVNFEIVTAHINSPKSKLEILASERTNNKLNRSVKELQSVILRETEIAGATFSIDSNSLKDALGKRYQPEDFSSFEEVPSILNIKQEQIDLAKLLKSKDLDTELLKFFNASKEYFTEEDKVVDSKFMNKIVSHVLENETELPEKAFTYLLTHPLFPNIEGLLSRLRSKPRLLRQAVVTANISINELLQELNTTDNDEIFKDVIARLLEFPREKLVFKDLDNFRIVERIISLNYGFELVSLLIDSTGFFTWNEELIEKLQETLTKKTDSMNTASKLLAVVQQVETKNLTTVSRVPVYSIEKLSI